MASMLTSEIRNSDFDMTNKLLIEILKSLEGKIFIEQQVRDEMLNKYNKKYLLDHLIRINFAYKGLYGNSSGYISFRTIRNIDTLINNFKLHKSQFDGMEKDYVENQKKIAMAAKKKQIEQNKADKIRKDKQQKILKEQREKKKKETEKIKILEKFSEKELANEIRRRGFTVTAVKNISL